MMVMSLVSLCFGALQVKKLLDVKKDIQAGMPPEEALDRLIEEDKTGLVAKIIEAHRSGIEGIGDMGDLEATANAAAGGDSDAANRLSQVAMKMSQGAAGKAGVSIANPLLENGKTGVSVKKPKAERLAPSKISIVAKGEAIEEGPGVAVLVDEKTGERIVLKSSRKPSRRRRSKKRSKKTSKGSGKTQLIPGLSVVLDVLGFKSLSETAKQRWVAYGALGGTVFFTMILVLWARRKFR